MEQVAYENLDSRIRKNAYPGRGIVIGKNEKGLWHQVYWIMGRSENSRNRIFVIDDGILKTQPADPGRVKDPSLIIYNAMRQHGKQFIVTNGDQTDTVYQALEQGKTFVDALLTRIHEPDAPNFTPRISGMVSIEAAPECWLSVIKADPFDAGRSEHQFYRLSNVQDGFGYTVTTYDGDGNPIPPFSRTPYLVPVKGDANEIAQAFWGALNEDNKISLAVRQIDPDTGATDVVIVNKYA